MKKLKKFTKNKAEELVQDFLNNQTDGADLSGYNSIDDSAAKILANQKRVNTRTYNQELRIYAPDFQTLSEKTAEILSLNVGDMLFDSIEFLTPKALAWLSESRCDQLHLGSLSKVNDSDIAILASFKGQTLCLGVKSISVSTAKALARRRGHLYLQNLESLADDVADALSSMIPNVWLGLDGITEITDSAAIALSRRSGWLSLQGLQSISRSAALSLSGIELLQTNQTVKKQMAKFIGSKKNKNAVNQSAPGTSTVSLNANTKPKAKGPKKGTPLQQLKALEDLDDSHINLINQVMKKQGFCFTHDKLRTITPLAAKEFSSHDCILILTLTELSEDVARELSRNKQPLDLKGFTSLSLGAAKALASYKGSQLYLSSLTSISEPIAKALASYKGQLDLSGIKSLSDDSAKALAGHKGELNLSGVTSLSKSAAAALGTHKGKVDLG